MIETSPSVPLAVPLIGEAEVEAAARVLRSGRLAQGPEVDAFEAELGALLGASEAIALNSGTAALHAALEASEVAEGDEVITTPFTFAATATSILMQRAAVRFVDIDPRTFNLEPDATLAAVGPRTKAVIPVDLFGLPYDRGLDVLPTRGVVVVEDACQAIGAKRDERYAGTLGHAGAFSFYATKNLTTGEGGMLVTADPKLAARARRFRRHGTGEPYEYQTLGFNYRMSEVAAAIGRVQLRRLPELTGRRRTNAAYYDRELGGIAGLTTPYVPPGASHAYHQYAILIDAAATPSGADRDRVRTALAQRGVDSAVYYPKPLHLQPLFAPCGYALGDFPVAERISRQILALPVHPALSREQLEAVARAVRAAVGVS